MFSRLGNWCFTYGFRRDDGSNSIKSFRTSSGPGRVVCFTVRTSRMCLLSLFMFINASSSFVPPAANSTFSNRITLGFMMTKLLTIIASQRFWVVSPYRKSSPNAKIYFIRLLSDE